MNSSESNSLSNIRYMPQLDGLRAIAVMGVLPVHFLSKSEFWLLSHIDTGDLGVKLFFVLSGFLIGSTLLTARDKIEQGVITTKQTVVNFYIRRALRLFPLYYAYLAMSFVLLPPVREHILWFLTYTQNILFYKDPVIFSTVLAHLWTLAIEEQFYMIAPIIILAASRKHLPLILIGLIIAAFIFRLFSFIGDVPRAHFLLPAQMDLLCMGVILALLAKGESIQNNIKYIKRILISVAATILFTSAFIKIGQLEEELISVIANIGLGSFFCWLIISAASGFTGYLKMLLEFAPLVFLGKISYGIYILHFNVPGLLREIILPRVGFTLPDHALFNFVLFTCVSIVIACISWYAFERPILSLKNKYKI